MGSGSHSTFGVLALLMVLMAALFSGSFLGWMTALLALYVILEHRSLNENVAKAQERAEKLAEQVANLTHQVRVLESRLKNLGAQEPAVVEAEENIETKAEAEAIAAPPATPAPTVEPESEAPPEPHAEPAAPPTPPRPPFDYEAAWRTLAGPFAGSGNMGSAAAAEARIGTVWFSRVGVLLLLIGGLFAYRYLVTVPALRVLIGYVAGAGMLGLGYWGHRRQYTVWAQAINGGGLGLLYLTTTAAANTWFFDPVVIPVPIAFGLMILITALGTGLAVFYDSITIGVLGMVGGFATPFLLSTGEGNVVVLFTYMAILNAGLLGVAYFKRWPLYNYLCFLATWSIYGTWRAAAMRPEHELMAFTFVSAFFLIFAFVSFLYNIVHRQQTRYQDLALAIINAWIYFGSGLDLLADEFAVARAFFAFTVALIYFGLGHLALVRNRNDRLLVLSFLGLSGIFLTIAFPVALNGPWITVAWALEGAALTWAAFYADMDEAKFGALAVLGVAALRLAVWDTFPGEFGDPLPVWWLRAFTFLSGVASFYLSAWAYYRYRGSAEPMWALALAGNLFTLWYMTLEIYLHYTQIPQSAGSLVTSVAAAYGLYGLALTLAELRLSHVWVRNGLRFLIGLAMVMMVLFGITVHGHQIALWLRLFSYASVLGASWTAELLIRRRGLDGEINGYLSGAAAVSGFGLSAFELFQYLRPALELPIGQAADMAVVSRHRSLVVFSMAVVWSAVSLIAMGVGILLRSAAARGLAGAFFLTTMGLVAVLGVTALQASVWLRAAAFVLLVPGTYFAVYLAAGTPGGQRGSVVMFLKYVGLAAALLTAWWGSAEVFALFGGTAAPRPGTPAYSVVTWLGLYALAVGWVGARIASANTRWLALALQGATLLGLLISTAAFAAGWPLKAAVLMAGIVGIYSAHKVFDAPDRTEREREASAWLSLAACALTALWIGFEVHRAYWSIGTPGPVWVPLESARNHWIIVALALYGLAVVGAGLWLRSFEARALGLGMSTLGALGVFTIAIANTSAPGWLRVLAYAAAVVSLYAATWAAGRYQDRTLPIERLATRWLSLGAGALTVIWLLFQVREVFGLFAREGTDEERATARSVMDFGISAVWGLYGFLVLAAGFVLRNRWTRVIGLGILALTLAKIGVYDMWRLEFYWRIWVTIGLGLIFVVASLMYQRFARLIIGADDPEVAA